MSSTEWIGRVPGDAVAVGLEHRVGLRREVGVLQPRVGEALGHHPVQLGVGLHVDRRAAVEALEVGRVDAAGGGQLVDQLLGPLVGGIELQAGGRVLLEHPQRLGRDRPAGGGAWRRRRSPAAARAPPRRPATSRPGAAPGPARRTRRPSAGSPRRRRCSARRGTARACRGAARRSRSSTSPRAAGRPSRRGRRCARGRRRSRPRRRPPRPPPCSLISVVSRVNSGPSVELQALELVAVDLQGEVGDQVVQGHRRRAYSASALASFSARRCCQTVKIMIATVNRKIIAASTFT